MFNLKQSYFISEIAQAHDGSLLMAHSMIEESKKSGFSAVKFQYHLANEESTKQDQFRIQIRFLPDKNRFNYWKRMEFEISQWEELCFHTKELNLDFICSPFSLKAIDNLEKIGCDIYKIGSGEFFNKELISYLLQTKKPIIISTGLSTLNEILDLNNYILEVDSDADVTFMHCTTSYPTPPNKIGISNISKIKKLLSANSVGFSDHSSDARTLIAAFFCGANIFEVHTTFSKNILGFDSSSSLTFEEAKTAIEDIRYFEFLLNNNPDKNTITSELGELKTLFSRSIVASRDLSKGEKITNECIVFKKPGGGLNPEEKDRVLGKFLNKALSKGSLITDKEVS